MFKGGTFTSEEVENFLRDCKRRRDGHKKARVELTRYDMVYLALIVDMTHDKNL